MDVKLEPVGPQALWEETFQKLGRSALAPRADESDLQYLRRVSRVGRKYVPIGEEICSVAFDHTLPDAVAPKYSEMMRQRVEANLRRTDNLDPNDTNYRVVHVTDQNTGMKIREFYRARPFTDDFKSFVRSAAARARKQEKAANGPGKSEVHFLEAAAASAAVTQPVAARAIGPAPVG
jgi:hypothetical protein